MVREVNHNKQKDADILQCKADILRARDIIPYKEGTQQKTKSQGTSPISIETAEVSATTQSTEQGKSEIPRFDLAEEIMAEQRKVTAIRRKAPDKEDETKAKELNLESINYTIKQPTLVSSEQEQIIAEIVARDIQKMCRDDYSTDSK